MRQFIPISGILLATVVPAPAALATDYLSLEAAQQSTFPQADSFTEVLIPQQSAQQLQALVSLSGPQPPHGVIRIWKATSQGVVLGHFFVDEVIGKENLITYAVGIDPSGTVHDLEILSYRESHGGEIRNPAWRSQFNDRRGLQQLRFGIDIKNISGATLSSEHVTQGVRWLMALWQSALRPTPAAG